MLKSLLPNKVKVKITFDDIRLRSNLTTNKTKKFTKNLFSRQFYVLLNPSQNYWVISRDSLIDSRIIEKQ